MSRNFTFAFIGRRLGITCESNGALAEKLASAVLSTQEDSLGERNDWRGGISYCNCNWEFLMKCETNRDFILLYRPSPATVNSKYIHLNLSHWLKSSSLTEAQKEAEVLHASLFLTKCIHSPIFSNCFILARAASDTQPIRESLWAEQKYTLDHKTLTQRHMHTFTHGGNSEQTIHLVTCVWKMKRNPWEYERAHRKPTQSTPEKCKNPDMIHSYFSELWWVRGVKSGQV